MTNMTASHIEITTRHPASQHGQPVILIDGQLVDPGEGFDTCLHHLGWSSNEAAEKIGRVVNNIRIWRRGLKPVPAYALNVLRDAIEDQQQEGAE
jgi:hypothetical protein